MLCESRTPAVTDSLAPRRLVSAAGWVAALARQLDGSRQTEVRFMASAVGLRVPPKGSGAETASMLCGDAFVSAPPVRCEELWWWLIVS